MRSDNAGVTLTEVVVSTVIIASITATSMIGIKMVQYLTNQKADMETNLAAQLVMNRVLSDVRNANYVIARAKRGWPAVRILSKSRNTRSVAAPCITFFPL